jgi:hypothetical protein
MATNLAPGQDTGTGDVAGQMRESEALSGARLGGDPVNEPGQYPSSLFGVALPQGTGAPGSQGAQNGGPGGTRVTYTRPGSFLSGTNQMDSVSDDISGPNDWTQAIDGSYGGGPQLPGIDGNMPAAGDGRYQPSSGHVLRGGYLRGRR